MVELAILSIGYDNAVFTKLIALEIEIWEYNIAKIKYEGTKNTSVEAIRQVVCLPTVKLYNLFYSEVKKKVSKHLMSLIFSLGKVCRPMHSYSLK